MAYNIEIERKFLVNMDKFPPLTEILNSNRIIQFYLSFEPEVRVVIRNYEKAEITIKSNGLEARDEFSYLIPVEEAKDLRKLAKGEIIEKTRFYFPASGSLLIGRIWEVDIYRGANKGLAVAEIELIKSTDLILREVPKYIGEEVTQDRRYKNASLAQNPFTTWK